MQGVLDSTELRMLRRVDYLRDRNILGESHVQSYVTPSVLMLGGLRWADSLLSLAFATRWNPKHPSYVSTWFFCVECRLYEMFKATDKWGKLLCVNYNMIDWISLWNNSRFIDKNGLVVKALDSQSRASMLKTTGWLQVRLSLSSLRGR